MKKILLLLIFCSSLLANATYFDYVKPQGTSQLAITEENIQKWIPLIDSLGSKLYSGDFSRLLTYLSVAERDATFLSYQTHTCLMGSLDPLIAKIIGLFCPDFDLPSFYRSDAYSEDLSTIVFEKFQDRYEKNNKDKWLLWNTTHYKIPPPPRSVEHEIISFHAVRDQLSEKIKNSSFEWTNSIFPRDKKSWAVIADDYMDKNGTCLTCRLNVMAELMMSTSDAIVTALVAKKAYAVCRPFDVDPNFEPLIEKPKSLSYPSGHSAVASAAACVLSYFFPEEKQMWNNLAQECALSRIWVGVHYPMDISEGLRIGESVLKEIYR